jgi:arsenate reductase (thioredoxin)
VPQAEARSPSSNLHIGPVACSRLATVGVFTFPPLDSAAQTPSLPERIRALLDAEPFDPFTVHLVDRHSVYIGDPNIASLEDDGRTLVVQTVVLRETYTELVATAAITRLLVKAPHETHALSQSEDELITESAPAIVPQKARVLFLCTRNSARSQMAEAWLNRLGKGQVTAESAGFEPGVLHPLAIEAMHEVGIDISQQKTKSIFDVYRSGALFTFTISVCDESAEKAPIFPGQTERLHWNVPDPLAGGDGSDAKVLARMRVARDSLREWIERWLSEWTTRSVPG